MLLKWTGRVACGDLYEKKHRTQSIWVYEARNEGCTNNYFGFSLCHQNLIQTFYCM